MTNLERMAGVRHRISALDPKQVAGFWIATADAQFLVDRIAKLELLAEAVKVEHFGSQSGCGICDALAAYEAE